MLIKKIFFFYIFISFFYNLYSYQIGITNLYTSNKALSQKTLQKLEDITISSIAGFDNRKVLNIKENTGTIKKYLKYLQNQDNTSDKSLENSADIKKNPGYNNFLQETKEIKYLISFEIIEYTVLEEPDFYDNAIIYYRILSSFIMLTIDMESKNIIDESVQEINFLSKKALLETEELSYNLFKKKINISIDDFKYQKDETLVIESNYMLVTLNKGKNDGVKIGDVYTAQNDLNYNTGEKTAIYIVKVTENKSYGMYFYTFDFNLKNENFTKQQKINLEILLGGGFDITDFLNVTTAMNGFANIKVIPPISFYFIKPVISADFNFFYKNSQFLMPFSIEAGGEARVNLHRFEFATGFLVGILFSLDTSANYILDCPVIRPYARIGLIINTTIRLFGEAGYRYYIEDNFSKNWKIALTGAYFNFGIGIIL